MWVHVYDPHAPYAPPPADLARAGGVAYDGEVAYVDGEIARLLAAVESRPDAPRTAVIVTGDHGEGLGEHGEATHGMLVFESTLRVPLIIRSPGVAPAERRDAASLIDLAPTVLALAGRPAAQLPGRNLLGPPATDPETYAESEYPRVAAWAPSRALVRERWKLVAGTPPALYDLAADPGEARDLAGTQPALAQAMSARLATIRAQGGATSAANPSTPIPEETARRLRSLGYVATAGAASTGEDGINAASGMAAWTAFESALSESTAGRTAQALPVLAKVAAAYPASPIFAATYARALAASGKPREALVRFRSAVTQWPTDWSLYHELAVVARDLGYADEAAKAEEAALTLNPAEPSALNGRGLLLADAGRHAEAAEAFAEATRHDPTNAVYAANLGNARRATGDLDAAASAYRRALEHAPGLADAANGLGVILVQQQKPADAVPWLEQAARDPAFVEAQLNLGIALQESGQLPRAKEQYRKVVASPGPHARERDAARTLLAQLEHR
jgi:tetratricopeptide (TPR) repeat protein